MNNNIQTEKLTTKTIFVFWYPLALTWLMMAIENPYLTAIIARLPDPKFNLAAFGVAFSFALIIEAPIIMIMSASTALVTDSGAFYKLRRFTYTLNISITLFLLICLLPPIFNYIANNLINLPPEVAHLTHIATLILVPWPAAIGYRRFYQGILIRNNKTRRVAYGTVVRLTTMSLTALTLYFLRIPGAWVGAGALSMGVMAEAMATRFMCRHEVALLQQNPKDSPTSLTYKIIIHFYYPLALTTILTLGVHPLVVIFIGKSRYALESLAVLPVINALVFIFRSVGLSFTEVALALLGKNNRNYLPLRNFALLLGSFTLSLFALLSFTPLSSIWFSKISGLSVALTAFSILPTQIITLQPTLTLYLSLQQALLMNIKKTIPITWATIIEITLIIGIIQMAIYGFNAIGAVASTLSFTVGRFGANLFLLPHQRRAIKCETPAL